MALNIPMPGQPGEAFLSGLDTGSAMFQRMMQPQIQREDMARQWRQHLDDLALRQQAAGRAQSLFDLERQMKELELEKARRSMDPQAQREYLDRVRQAFGSQAPREGVPSAGAASPDFSTVATPMISTALGNMSLQEAQQIAAAGIPIPGLQEGLKAHYEGQQALSKETAKESVKQQAEAGAILSEVEEGLGAIGRIHQLRDNYAKEAAEKGYKPRYGIGAMQRTDPDAWERYKGRAKQFVAHPIETLLHPLDYGFAFGAGEGTEMHDKYLSELRSELNELVNTRAKALNTRFTQNEYKILQDNKASIGDGEPQLVGKLRAAENAFRSAAFKLRGQQAFRGSVRPGEESFALGERLPGEKLGRSVVGAPQVGGFIDANNPAKKYFTKDGKFYEATQGE
jgi:hypothetical protein